MQTQVINPSVAMLQAWFDNLSEIDKQAVLKHVYKNIYIERNNYKGPDPTIVLTPSIFLGPAPVTPAPGGASSSVSCPNCGHTLTINVS